MSELSTNDRVAPMSPQSVAVIAAAPAPSAAAPEADPSLTLEAVERVQETDIWWGAYSGWTMLPSFLVCLLLTGAIVWIAFTALRPMAKTVIVGAGATIWLIQLLRWSHRSFAFSYRLTNRRIFIDRGFLFSKRLQVELGAIAGTDVQQERLERLLGIGKVCLRLHRDGGETLVLAGVTDPQKVARCVEETRLRLVKSTPCA